MKKSKNKKIKKFQFLQINRKEIPEYLVIPKYSAQLQKNKLKFLKCETLIRQ